MDRRVGVKADHEIYFSPSPFMLPHLYNILQLFCKTGRFSIENSDISFVRNIDCGYSLEPRRF